MTLGMVALGGGTTGIGDIGVGVVLEVAASTAGQSLPVKLALKASYRI